MAHWQMFFISIFALMYLKVLAQIASLFSVKYFCCRVIPKWPQKQSIQHQSSFSLDYVITLQTPRDIYIEILALWDCRPLWSMCDPHATRLSIIMVLTSCELDSLVRVPGGGGGCYFLMKFYGGCAAGWGHIFKAALTIMGSHFQ